MRKKEVVKMLKEMQKTVYNSVMFEKAGPQQKWIIENLLGSAIAELDEYPYAIGLKWFIQKANMITLIDLMMMKRTTQIMIAGIHFLNQIRKNQRIFLQNRNA